MKISIKTYKIVVAIVFLVYNLVCTIIYYNRKASPFEAENVTEYIGYLCLAGWILFLLYLIQQYVKGKKRNK